MSDTTLYIKLLQEQTKLLKEQNDIYRKHVLEYSTQNRYFAVKQLSLSSSSKYSISRLCEILRVSQRGYYDWLKKHSKPFLIS